MQTFIYMLTYIFTKMIKFIQKIWKTGKEGSFVVTIPKAFVDSNLLNTDKNYLIIIEEVNKHE